MRKRVALGVLAVLVAVTAAYILPIVSLHWNPTLVYLRENGHHKKADLAPAVLPANATRSMVHDHFSNLGFRGPFELMRLPNGEFYADEGYAKTNLLWHYDIRFIYDEEGRVKEGWGISFEPFFK